MSHNNHNGKNQGSHAPAIRTLQEEISERLRKVGNLHYESGDIPGAQAAYEQALANNPSDWKAHFNLGNLHFHHAHHRQDLLAAAIHHLERTVSLKSDHAHAHELLGAAFKQQGQIERAVAAFERVVSLGPAEARVWNELGLLYQDADDFQKALASIRKACELAPEDPDFLYNLGNLQYESKDFQAARESYEKALEKKPGDLQILNNLADARLRLNDLEGALETINAVLALRQDYPAALCTRGEIYEALEKFEDAALAYAQTIRLAKKTSLLSRYASDRARVVEQLLRRDHHQ